MVGCWARAGARRPDPRRARRRAADRGSVAI